MKSVFEVGFRSDFQGHRLGQFDWGSLFSAIPGLVQTGVDIYQAREAEKAAEKAREKAEAAAAAARAAQEAARLEQEKIIQEQARAAAAPSAGETVLGVPRDIAIWGGVGLLAVIGVIAIVK